MYAELCYKIDMKQCSKCHVLKEFSEFKKDSRVKSGKQAECKSCIKSRRVQKYSQYRLAEKKRELRKYALTYEQYVQMLEVQNYTCATCSRKDGDFKRALHVDHCHKTGKVRSLLCSHCNTVLGKVNDDTSHLDRLKEYLIRHRSEG